MSLSAEQLAKLTQAVNQRRAEFGTGLLDPLHPGDIRLVLDVWSDYVDEEEEPVGPSQYHLGYGDGKTHAAPTNGVYVTPPPVAEYIAANPPFTALPATRPVPRGLAVAQPRTLEEVDAAQEAPTPRELDDVDADEDGDFNEELSTRHDRMARLSADDKADMLREVLHTLQEISVDGVMPGRTTFDARKPAGMAQSQTIVARYRLSWRELAAYARLSYRGGAVSDGAGE